MSIRRMNMIEHMNKAWSEKGRLDVNTFEEHCKNLVTHAYVELERIYKNYCSDKDQVYKDEVFYIFQRIFVFIMKCDGEFLQGEYDAYCKFCKWAKIQALTVADVNALYSRTSVDTVIEDIKLINGLREFIDGDNYNAMVLGWCYLSLLGDGKFDENEYYIIRCFYDARYDYSPRDWAQFKREWC